LNHTLKKNINQKLILKIKKNYTKCKKKIKKFTVLIVVIEYKRDFDTTKNIEDLYVNIAEEGAVIIQ